MKWGEKEVAEALEDKKGKPKTWMMGRTVEEDSCNATFRLTSAHLEKQPVGLPKYRETTDKNAKATDMSWNYIQV